MLKTMSIVCSLYVIVVCWVQGTYGWSRKACYDPIGCFYPRAFGETLPDDPQYINTRFTFYTNNQRDVLEAVGQTKYNFASFDPNLKTAILLDGSPEYSPANWTAGRFAELRTQENLNVIFVDWNAKGANSVWFNTMEANLRVVGAQIGLLLQDLRRVHDIDLETITITGYSLQAHVATYLLTDIADTKTINGYDPIAYATSHTTSSDVILVDILHDASKYGVCYNLLGCFPCRYEGETLPENPKDLHTKFKFYTNKNEEGQSLPAIDIGQEGFIFSGVTFNKSLETKVIIHGWMEDSDNNETWVLSLVDELRSQEHFNIIVVDWKEGADSYKLAGAASNARVIGAQIALLLKNLRRVYGINPGTVHIIGYSLGAHVAGYAGASLTGIGRITALDAAGYWFETAHSFSSLDPSDALFVDAIHTDSFSRYGFGIKRRVGTVDFYVNGGLNQPGCKTGLFNRCFKVVTGDSVCSHNRAVELFVESINSEKCHFVGYPCEDINNYDTCTTCGDGCVQMGFHSNLANQMSKTHRKYSVNTNSEKPFCSNREAKNEGIIHSSINDIPL